MYIGEESGCQLVPEPWRVIGRFLENELRMFIIMPPLLSAAMPGMLAVPEFMPGISAIAGVPTAAGCVVVSVGNVVVGLEGSTGAAPTDFGVARSAAGVPFALGAGIGADMSMPGMLGCCA